MLKTYEVTIVLTVCNTTEDPAKWSASDLLARVYDYEDITGTGSPIRQITAREMTTPGPAIVSVHS